MAQETDDATVKNLAVASRAFRQAADKGQTSPDFNKALSTLLRTPGVFKKLIGHEEQFFDLACGSLEPLAAARTMKSIIDKVAEDRIAEEPSETGCRAGFESAASRRWKGIAETMEGEARIEVLRNAFNHKHLGGWAQEEALLLVRAGEFASPLEKARLVSDLLIALENYPKIKPATRREAEDFLADQALELAGSEGMDSVTSAALFGRALDYLKKLPQGETDRAEVHERAARRALDVAAEFGREPVHSVSRYQVFRDVLPVVPEDSPMRGEIAESAWAESGAYPYFLRIADQTMDPEDSRRAMLAQRCFEFAGEQIESARDSTGWTENVRNYLKIAQCNTMPDNSKRGTMIGERALTAFAKAVSLGGGGTGIYEIDLLELAAQCLPGGNDKRNEAGLIALEMRENPAKFHLGRRNEEALSRLERVAQNCLPQTPEFARRLALATGGGIDPLEALFGNPPPAP